MSQKSNIHFEFEDITQPPFFNQARLTEWLNAVAKSHSTKIKAIQYVFCDDEYLIEINRTHLDHDYYTDIITFPLQEGKLIEADILISLERVEENASEFGVTFENELLRVMVHGLLHLTGMSDKNEEDAAKMRQEENSAISLYESMN